jgi:2-polyprenyl-3-methyl-5-hydroxy-6-metoxy-1,4-benzoquinol methylase
MIYLTNCPICKSIEIEEHIRLKDYFLTKEEFTITRCKSCGFRFTNPKPQENDIGRYYDSSEYISHTNTEKGLFNKVYHYVRNFAIKRKINLIRQYINQGTVLDIGCGSGEFLNALSEKGYQTFGIEPNKNAREQAIAKYELDIKEEKGLHDFKPSSIEIITLWHVLEHVYNLDDRIKQIKKIIKPEGIVIIAVPNPNSYDAKIYDKYWAAYDVPRHLYHFAQSDMLKLMRTFSFELIKTVPMKFDSYYVSLLSEKYRSGSRRLIPAIVNGFCSNLFALTHQKNYSSLIYIFKPKKA